MQIRQQKRSYSFAAMLLLITFAADFAAGRPDVRQSPFALELQPPLLQPAEEAFNPTTAGGQKTIDSYGNPIDALRPIDTPDGRKVVSAQGVQFEIPTYASGITEIRRPADDLLPPHIDAIAVGLEPSSSSSDPKPNSFLGTASASSAPAPIPATSLTPPHHDPSPDTTTNAAAAAAAAVEVEQAHIEPLPQQQEDLPEYLRELQRQDPNIGGPVAWQPSEAGVPLIAYDLLPPHQDQEKKDQEQTEQEPVIITQEQQQPAKRVQGIVDPISHNIRLSLSSGSAALSSADPQPQAQEHHQTQVLPQQQQQQSQADGPAAHGTNAHVGSTTPSNAAGRFPNRQRGTAHYSTTRSSSTTLRPRTSTTTTTTTTTTQAPTTTSTSTARTTHRTTTRTTSTTRAPTTSTPRTPTTTEDPASFYSLDNAEEYAYTLPTWLQEVTDPDLDVAVTFVVPTDNDQYNHTLASDLEPPYEPFVDLGNIQLTPPPTAAPPAATSSTTLRSTTTSSTPRTTTTTTTTRKPTTTQTTTTTTTRRPSTKRTTNAPIPTTTHSIPAHPELIQTQNQIKIQPADAAPEDLGRRSTSSTPSSLDVNPFDSATIPAWLRDFDYPDVGPGVPFDPDNFGSQPAASSSSNQSPTSPPRPFTNLPTASSAFPSKVTLPLPGSGTTSFPSAASSSSSEEPPLVLIPPAERPDSGLDTGSSSVPGSVPGPLTQPSTNSITPFAARFDPQESSGNGIGSADSLPPLKVEYTKSDEGKVISTPVASIPRKTESPTPATTSSSSTSTIGSGGKYTGGFGAPAGLLRPLAAGSTNQSPGSNSDIYVAGEDNEYSSRVKANKARPTVNPGRYNGGFRAPTGVLSPQAEPRPFQAQASSSSSSGAAPIGGQRRTDSRFGGPPGILVPFDNVQRPGGQ